MFFKKVNISLPESYVDITVENHDNDSFVLCLCELTKNEEKSTPDCEVLEPKSTTEVYLGIEEVKEIISTLESVLPKE